LKERKANSKTEKIGLNYVEKITNDMGHIFRRVLDEDVGIDASIELCRNENIPTGTQIGLQIKSGNSYLNSKNDNSFTYYPSIDDLQYWNNCSFPVYIIIYSPKEKVAYWADIKEFLENYNFEDIISGITHKKIIINKNNTLTGNFFEVLEGKYTTMKYGEYWYDNFLQNLMNVSFTNENIYPLEILKSFYYIDVPTAEKLLNYLNSRFDELVNKLTSKGLDEQSSNNYINMLVIEIQSIIFEREKTGFLLITFEKIEDRDAVLKTIEEFIPFNKYLILKGEMMLPLLPMNYCILIASDCWENGQININFDIMGNLENIFGLEWNINYDIGYYDPKAASIFLTKHKNFDPGYIFYIVYDTEDDFLIFNFLRLYSRREDKKESNGYLWVSIGEDRVKAYRDWDPATYEFLDLVLRIRDDEELTSFDYFLLENEFDICQKEEIENLICKVKAANSLEEIPFMYIDSIKEGMEWGSKLE
jgi:hypothetical protein